MTVLIAPAPLTNYFGLGQATVYRSNRRREIAVTNAGDEAALRKQGMFSLADAFSGDVALPGDLSVAGDFSAAAGVFATDLPADDPEVEGQLWNDAGAVKVSEGPGE